MSQKTILVIDDSATIRRLVDRCLTAAGYRVVAASTAEDGIEFAGREAPDLILLDHQLPGATGTDVASQLLEVPSASQVPVVVSSTLRKKAYAEYMELPNVVDMLPKPYTEELLTTTVENALSTAAIVVHSQSEGTAVPEVLQQTGEPELSGKFGAFNVREVLDFLTNSNKCGLLEVEAEGCRVFFSLANGRVNGVSASGVSADTVVRCLPPALENLAPVVNLTIGGRGGSELEGIVELLNRKVVDPRLLRKLLRHQAAVLVWRCFNGKPAEFRFSPGGVVPPLVAKLPLEVSVLALLIEGALVCDTAELPEEEGECVYTRRAVRGQNLDRAGVSAQHMKVLNVLGERHSVEEVSQLIGCTIEEARRVLFAMLCAGLVDRTKKSSARNVVVFESNPVAAGKLREAFSQEGCPCIGRVVRDRLALQLVLRRVQPDVFVIDLSSQEAIDVVQEHQTQAGESAAKWYGVLPEHPDAEQSCRERLSQTGIHFDELMGGPMQTDKLFAALDEAGPVVVRDETQAPDTASAAVAVVS